MPRNIIDAVQGTLETLILRALQTEALHGYGIARWILDASGEELRIEEGTLYPALHRMEGRGLIEAEWGVSENNRRAKFYRITRAGAKELNARLVEWRRYAGAMDRALREGV
jgi:PadR family transcriptional regulator PadR